jgi:hypothetical protein
MSPLLRRVIALLAGVRVPVGPPTPASMTVHGTTTWRAPEPKRRRAHKPNGGGDSGERRNTV